ncbi:MAG: phosphate/phosphite/phosphonate ABC transporter substrate-binding protein [Pseudohongiella sp.]|nr:phosphate/phosphite/phosphonate ABC transporter substrate-binding protein [Pseudohongiella sp.]MDP2284024.1 phosphate/phosphite/phosphonate ABC transporter substrate-binding protein [Pseudohongiella sp.]
MLIRDLSESIKQTLLCTVLMVVAGTAVSADFSVGVVPQFEAQRINTVWRPILDELSTRTGHTFHLRGEPSIPAFEQALGRGDYDFVYMNPWHAVIANELQGYVPLVKDGDLMLTGILVVAENSPVTDPMALDGQEIVFPSPNALGASLLMRADLQQIFGIRFTPVYVQTHPSVYLNVAVGSSAAGGGVRSTLLEQPHILQEKLRIIYETREMFPHPLAVHPRVDAEAAAQVMNALLQMGQESDSADLLRHIPMSKPVPAHIDDYLILKEWGLGEVYVQE